MATVNKLSEDDIDSIIYDARAGDLESLQEVFKTVSGSALVSEIVDEYSLSTPFHMAAANGHTEVLKYLFSLVSTDEAKTLANKQNESGNTPLHWAALNGHVDAIIALCDVGADPFLRNKAGHDAIYEAERNNKEELETYFLKRFALEQENENEDGEISYSIKEGTEIQEATKDGIEAQKELELEKKEREELESKTKELESKTEELQI